MATEPKAMTETRERMLGHFVETMVRLQSRTAAVGLRKLLAGRPLEDDERQAVEITAEALEAVAAGGADVKPRLVHG